MNKPSAVSALFDQEPILASPPEVYFQVMRALNDPDTNYDHIPTLLDKDPSLSARLLHETFPAGFEFGEQHLTIDDFIESLSLKIDQHFNEIFFLFYN